MYRNFIILLILLTITLGAAGCDPVGSDDYIEYPVVEAYLVADRPLPKILLTTTLPAGQKYSFDEAAIRGAELSVFLLDEQGNKSESGIGYRMRSNSPGIYLPTESHIVQPLRDYLLIAEIPGHGVMRAQTTIPDTFRIIGDIPEEIVYQSADQLEITITPNLNPGRQNVYLFNTIARNPEFDMLTPFYRGIMEEDENNLEDIIINPSNLVNEGNFQKNPDGSILLRFPWIGVAFYGENQIVTNSLDRNLVDFIRSQEVQLGGSTLSPGEIPNAIYHVEGGIGVFGGVASDTVTTTILPPN